MIERYMLSVERISTVQKEKTVHKTYLEFFQKTAEFILNVGRVREKILDGTWEALSQKELQKENEQLYGDILKENYETSYANPSYAVKKLGETYGALLSFLYVEMRGEIAHAFENQLEYLTICNELFIEIYNAFEEVKEPEYSVLKNIIYWYAGDYCDVFVADRVKEQIDPSSSFAAEIIKNADLDDIRYLYRFGEYITNNEIQTAQHLKELPEETIQKMADVYTQGYHMGFINGGKDLSKKSVVNIRYQLGFERMVKKAIDNFEEMGLKPTIYRAAVSVLTKKMQYKVGYYGAVANKQYEYDHRGDQALFLDKRFLERKLDAMKNVYEKNKELAAQFAGPAVIEVFGEEPFAPEQKKESLVLNEKQEQLSLMFESKTSQLTNRYIKGEERSFTIIAYPVPDIGKDYEAIFDETIRINTLDAKQYEEVQQKLIDVLDKGRYVHVLGRGCNQTDLKIQLYPLQSPQTETIFENCVADVNIPVGEVFTSPVLLHTEGVLHVSKVYLNELQYLNLKMVFTDGKITDYSCDNFEQPEEGKKYIHENILHHHETLPLGEFAIGTNTTAYAVAKKYGIEDKMPILIAEKMGPHFAVGDTCYSYSEDSKIYNPNGKEIVAKDNEVSILRKETPEKAYLQCHTDITIPYEELEEISVVTESGERIPLLQEGRFVLPGTELLNEPLKELE
ncbi:MAG: aminopeptidase [Lachnospiraceae bacterium]